MRTLNQGSYTGIAPRNRVGNCIAFLRESELFPSTLAQSQRKIEDLVMHFLLFYEAGEDYVARRAAFRAAHLELAWAASERGELVLGGALADPVDGALLLFEANSPSVAENFARVDPYVTSGLVKRWHVRQWNTVVGDSSTAPVRPAAARS
jgi:uncharacterized protein